MLEQVTMEQAKHALHKLIHAGSAFPPTLPEFVAQVKTFRQAAIFPFPQQALPPAVQDREKIKANLTRLREMLASDVPYAGPK
jgi:hypothetical protein